MLRRFASVMAGGALAVTAYSVMVAAPASAGGPSNTVEVTKVVQGDSKGTGFQVVVTCEPEKGSTHSDTLTFGPQGGTESSNAPLNSTCTVVETHDGGASNVTVSGSPCDFTLKDEAGSAVQLPVPKKCSVTVTNTFVPEVEEAGPAGPPGPQGPPGESAAATAVVSTARFTG
jgi:hypothetical protein